MFRPYREFPPLWKLTLICGASRKPTPVHVVVRRSRKIQLACGCVLLANSGLKFQPESGLWALSASVQLSRTKGFASAVFFVSWCTNEKIWPPGSICQLVWDIGDCFFRRRSCPARHFSRQADPRGHRGRHVDNFDGFGRQRVVAMEDLVKHAQLVAAIPHR
jgi:hypothetical protein